MIYLAHIYLGHKDLISIHSVIIHLHVHPSAVRFFSNSPKRKGVTAVGHTHNFSCAQNEFKQKNLQYLKWGGRKTASMIKIWNDIIVLQLPENGSLPSVLTVIEAEQFQSLARTFSAHTQCVAKVKQHCICSFTCMHTQYKFCTKRNTHPLSLPQLQKLMKILHHSFLKCC